MPAIEPEPGPWAPWAAREPSMIADHGGACCAEARAWFLAMNRSLWRGADGPAWIRRRWDWGPTRWPLHWCEAVAAEELCCGAQGALSVLALRTRGVEAAPVQLVQRYEPHHHPHWHQRWTRGGANPAWAVGTDVYHEACAVLEDGGVRVWNATDAAWLPPESIHGYASVVAIRVVDATAAGRTVTWGAHALTVGEWRAVGRPEAASLVGGAASSARTGA